MFDSKKRKRVYEYAKRIDKRIDDLTHEDYQNMFSEILDESDITESRLLERNKIINPILKKSYDVLSEAYNANTNDEMKIKALEAFHISNECFEALQLVNNLEDDYNERLKNVELGIRYQKDKLNKLGYFDKKYEGKFYEIIVTRNYIRLLKFKVDTLIFLGRIGMAYDLCLEILRLNKSDDLGVKYTLLNIYAYKEDEESLLKLESELNEHSLETLVPMLILYYKLDKMDKVNECLEEITSISSDFISFFKTYVSGFSNENIPESMLEILESTGFFINTTPGLIYYMIVK